MTHTELETAYNALCTKVERDAKRIFGLAGTGRAEAAAEAAAVLAEYAATCKAQHDMTKEVSVPDADRYSLKTLQRPREDV